MSEVTDYTLSLDNEEAMLTPLHEHEDEIGHIKSIIQIQYDKMREVAYLCEAYLRRGEPIPNTLKEFHRWISVEMASYGSVTDILLRIAAFERQIDELGGEELLKKERMEYRRKIITVQANKTIQEATDTEPTVEQLKSESS